MREALGRRTVLIVDDEPDIRLVVRLVLEEHYAIQEASSGADALVVLRTATESLIVLLDLSVGTPTGPLYAAIAADPQLLTRHTYITMTGRHPDAFPPDLPPWPVLAKPFGPDEVLTVLSGPLSVGRLHEDLDHYDHQL